MKLALIFDPATELEIVRQTLDRLDEQAPAAEGLPAPTTTADETALPPTPAGALATMPVVTLYEETHPDHRSRKLLEALTDKGETFEDLAPKMPNADGSLLSNAQMRAVYRNLRRTEGRLIAEGTLAEPVLQTDFNQYEQDGAGRYFLSPNSYAALNKYLGR